MGRALEDESSSPVHTGSEVHGQQLHSAVSRRMMENAYPSHTESEFMVDGKQCTLDHYFRCLLRVMNKLRHHGFGGMVVIIFFTAVSFVAKIVRALPIGGGLMEFIIKVLSWFISHDSVTSVSFVNYLDDNFEIGRTDFPVHSNTLTATNAEVLILASKLAYENMDKWVRVVTSDWKMEWVAGYSFEPQGTQAFIFKCKTAMVVAFRGTEPFNLSDWLVDFEVGLTRAGENDKNPDRALLGYMHSGFYDALMTPPNCSCKNGQEDDQRTIWYRSMGTDGIPKDMGWLDERLSPYDIVRDRLMEELCRDKNLYVFVTGHSLGAALASVFCGHLLVDEDPEDLIKPRVQLLCTFGQPRTGGYKFSRFLDCAGNTNMTSMTGEDGKPIGFRYLRFVNNTDIVPRVPPPVRFSHSSTFIFFNEFGYEEVDCESQGGGLVGIILDELMSWLSWVRRTKELFWNSLDDLAKFELIKPIVRFVVWLLPNLIYNHFPSEYERNIRRCQDPYYGEDQWVEVPWPLPLVG